MNATRFKRAVLSAIFAVFAACGPGADEPDECYPPDPWADHVIDGPQSLYSRGFCQYEPNEQPEDPAPEGQRYVKYGTCVPRSEAACTGLCENSEEVETILRDAFAEEDRWECTVPPAERIESVLLPGCRQYLPDDGLCCYSAVVTSTCTFIEEIE